MKYYVQNYYNLKDNQKSHRTVEAALKASDKREGDGWYVVDENGTRWDRDFDGRPVVID